MILELVESDKPKTIGEKISEFLARPPLPILRFYGEFRSETGLLKRQLLFSVRNGVPLPLFYGIYVTASHDGGVTEYSEKTDHIGPFSIDDWRLEMEAIGPVQLEVRLGLVPFEIMTDRVEVII